MYVNPFVKVAAPAGLSTVTSTTPLPAGVVTVNVVALVILNAAGVLPNKTCCTPLKFVPLSMTVLPPVDGPLFGDTVFTVGGGGGRGIAAVVPPANPGTVIGTPSASG